MLTCNGINDSDQTGGQSEIILLLPTGRWRLNIQYEYNKITIVSKQVAAIRAFLSIGRKRMNQSHNEEDETIYNVVVNHERQYSIWPADQANALGWENEGKTGKKSECLSYIKEVWTDMRPLSLQKAMKENAKSK